MKRSELRKIIKEEVIKVARAMKKIKMSKLFEADSKIYIPKGQKAPKGKKLQTGPRGGQYFMGSAEEKENYAKSSSTSKKTSKPNRKSGAQKNVREPKGNIKKYASDLEKIRKKGTGGQDAEAEYLKKIFPNEKYIGEMVYIRDTFRFSEQPKNESEMEESQRQANEYWRMLKGNPELKKLGFDEDDVQEFDELDLDLRNDFEDDFEDDF